MDEDPMRIRIIIFQLHSYPLSSLPEKDPKLSGSAMPNDE
jgi:hypothetical protein